jgi:hypothetical protein
VSHRGTAFWGGSTSRSGARLLSKLSGKCFAHAVRRCTRNLGRFFLVPDIDDCSVSSTRLFVELPLTRNDQALGNCVRFPLVSPNLSCTKGRLSMVISVEEKWSPFISAPALGLWCGGSPFQSSFGNAASFTGITHAPWIFPYALTTRRVLISWLPIILSPTHNH